MIGQIADTLAPPAPLPAAKRVLCNNIMPAFPDWPVSDPLALSSGIAARLALAGGIAALLWVAVAWAMAA